MNREDAYKKLFTLEDTVDSLSTYVKRKLGIPVNVISKIDTIGELAVDIEAYAMANNDKDILIRMSKIKRGYLIYYINNYSFNDELLKEIRISIEKALNTFSRIYLLFNPEISLDDNENEPIIPFELTNIVNIENNENQDCKTVYPEFPEPIKKVKNQVLVKVDKEMLKLYFRTNFKGGGNSPVNYFSMLIEELERGTFIYKDLALIALMIHKSKYASIHINMTFSEWYEIFSNCIGVEKKSYEPKDLRKKPSDKILKLFSYLEPKEL